MPAAPAMRAGLPGLPLGVVLADGPDDRRPVGQDLRDLQVSGADQRGVRAEHLGLRPVEQPVPEVAGQDQRRVVQVPHLEELPDHQRFQHRPDAAGRDDERVGHQDEVVQPGEERLVLERLGHERVHVLLERQLDADADRLLSRPVGSASFTPSFAACISPGPPPVTMSQPEPGQFGGGVADGGVHPVARIDAGRAEDGDAVAVPLRRPQPGQVVDRVPQPERTRTSSAGCRATAGSSDRGTSRAEPSRRGRRLGGSRSMVGSLPRGFAHRQYGHFQFAASGWSTPCS